MSISKDMIEFRKELKSLLEKYRVSINFCADDCSDWHGITDGHMAICDEFHGNEIERLTNNTELSASDL